MEMNASKLTTTSDHETENSLKSLLEMMLSCLEEYIKTVEDKEKVEKLLNDYENNIELVEVLKKVFYHLVDKISKTSSPDYDKLEKNLQKHEAEIRNHIRIEQQLKLCAESLQSRVEELEKEKSEFLETTKKTITALKKDNQELSSNLQKMKENNESNSNNISKLKEENERLKNLTTLLKEKVKFLEDENISGRKTGDALSQTQNTDSSVKKDQIFGSSSKLTEAQIESLKAARAYNMMNQSRGKLREKSGGSRPMAATTNSGGDSVKIQVELRNKIGEMKKSGSFINVFAQLHDMASGQSNTQKDFKAIYSSNPIRLNGNTREKTNERTKSTHVSSSTTNMNQQPTIQASGTSTNNSFVVNKSQVNNNAGGGDDQHVSLHRRSKSQGMNKSATTIIPKRPAVAEKSGTTAAMIIKNNINETQFQAMIKQGDMNNFLIKKEK